MIALERALKEKKLQEQRVAEGWDEGADEFTLVQASKLRVL
jgi:hypothetical protein